MIMLRWQRGHFQGLVAHQESEPLLANAEREQVLHKKNCIPAFKKQTS